MLRSRPVRSIRSVTRRGRIVRVLVAIALTFALPDDAADPGGNVNARFKEANLYLTGGKHARCKNMAKRRAKPVFRRR